MCENIETGGLRLKGISPKKNDNLPIISIITIVYNGEKHLEKTIQSVVNQNYDTKEYIIIDAGSNDKSLEIIKKYEDKIDFWISEPDKGISDAFNKGLSLVTGDLIGIINSDDWYEESAFQKVVEYYSPKYKIYYGNLRLFDHNSKFIKHRKSRIWLLSLGMYIMHPTVFVSKEVYNETGGFNDLFKIAMDYDLFLKIKKNTNFKFKYINANIANMRMIGVSQDIKKMQLEEKIIRMKYLSRVELFITNFIIILVKFVKNKSLI